MVLRYRYSEWDGSQEIPDLDPDHILDNLTDDLMNFGDLQHALRNMLQRGMRDPSGQRLPGLRDLLQQLRQQRRQALDRYNLSSAFDDIKKQLNEIVQMEKETLTRRTQEAQPQQGAPEGSQQGTPSVLEQAEQALRQAQQPGQQQGGQGEGDSPTGKAGQPPSGGPREGAPGEGQSGRSGQQAGEGAPDEFAEMLRKVVERKQSFLDQLPADVGGAVKELQNYEFMDPEAQAKFQELMETLKKAMMDTFFKDLSSTIQDMTPEQLQRIKDMAHDLNQMLEQRARGEEPDFEQFMRQYGDMFGPNPPQSLDELLAQMQAQMAQMQSLLDSLPADMRQQLQDLLMDKIGDPQLQSELAQLAANLEYLLPSRDLRNQYPFRGDEELDLREAMHLMDRMQSIDELERQLERTQYGGDVEDVDLEKLREVLGDEAAEALEQLRKLLEVLEEAGYIRKRGNTWELTPRGTRKIGQRALAEIYAQLKKDSFGRHATRERGSGGDRDEDTKIYEYGDPFLLHMERTIRNAVYRNGPGVPVKLQGDDFEVYRTETLTQTATVIMLDLSWSMALRGSFQAAKKVAMALNNLIRSMFPRDSLYTIGFSAYARELQADQLPYVRWDESVLGTNMHHALMLAQNLLSKHKVGTRQIIMISDGEPTAHLERGRSYFAYPPSPITIRETLKEVRRCTQKDIVINTFMLDRNYYLKEFVNQVARINKGRVFYTTPDKLGEYILVDYVASKRKQLRGV